MTHTRFLKTVGVIAAFIAIILEGTMTSSKRVSARDLQTEPIVPETPVCTGGVIRAGLLSRLLTEDRRTKHCIANRRRKVLLLLHEGDRNFTTPAASVEILPTDFASFIRHK